MTKPTAIFIRASGCMSTSIQDTTHPGVRFEYNVESVVYRERTPFQEVVIADSAIFGRMLFMDGILQSAECDEGVYHSALVHPAMFTHARPRRVFIGGGAEGATLREVLLHPGVEAVTMVDIDEMAVRACRKYLGRWHRGAFEDARLKLIHDDVRAVLAGGERYDVVILDLGDPASSEASRRAATVEFYGLVHRCLDSGAIVALQAGDSDMMASRTYGDFVATLREVFPHVRPYRVPVPSFCSVWGFALGGNDPLPAIPLDFDERFELAGPAKFCDYDRDGHRAMMWFSPREARELSGSAQILTDRTPVRLRQRRE